MRLFWKVFLLLLATLVLTAAISGWLSQKWLEENRSIELQMAALAAPAETAAALYRDGGLEAYRQWQRHTLRRDQHIHGRLLDKQGNNLHMRSLPPELQELSQQVIKQQGKIEVVNPPLLAVALPVSYQGETYYWAAFTRLQPESIQHSVRQSLVVRLTVALLAIALISWLLTRMFTRPIRILQKTTEQLGAGSLNARTDPYVASRKDELGALACSIDKMAVQLESLISSHKQLLRDISHELRSPLARLHVGLELARSAAGKSAQEELNRIEKEANLLNELISEVLTLARIEQGAVEIQRQPLQLDEIVDEIVADAAFEAEAQDKTIRITEQVACRISGDHLWISRALDNVIRNAIRHTPVGSGVEVSLTRSGEQIKIEVRDFGSGADEAILAKLFEPFVRGSEARERHSGSSGYGLGLAIARDAIELHDGDISAANHKESGLIITIALPCLDQ
ncbi:two-component system, OmpR family, sensor histidine kinase CpxA [Mariprofundus aestuarium]|uniref:histidine kinase n=1 Tax=Mariprofundus aestuarium TaxID=1921086 RepID=A0A2K8KW94_MARES|nr:ATP-binding protein [Mariprofundus aestuarium]ATX79073.1 two-component system, OmpR family, sensor histidine kinase CpxA [Mariprofundus aestuarium]